MNFPPAEVAKARKRLGLKANPRMTPRLRERPTEQHAKPDPLAVAQKWVEGFDRLTMTHHSKPIKLPT
ncbi:MAG TPA: hypothetical protein VNH11_17675 [Pirellulales bacterium]|nr:hypothetical protein [Pirellulales bacterium]